jgi:hypothetical protein
VPQKSLPTRTLRERPDLDQLKRQAKELLDAFVAGRAGAAIEVNAHYHDARAETFALHDAQLVLARAYGFDSWPKLPHRVATGALTIATERGYAEIVDIIRMEERCRDAPDPRAMPALHRLFEVIKEVTIRRRSPSWRPIRR